MVADDLRALALALPLRLVRHPPGSQPRYRAMRPTVIVDKIGRSTPSSSGYDRGSAGSFALVAPLWAVPYMPAATIGWYWLRRIRRVSGRRGRQA